MTIACLHTAASNIAIFDAAAHASGMPLAQLSHLVMPHLLAEAELSGGMTAAQQQRLTQMLHSLTPWFDAILITCSTLGAVADGMDNAQARCPIYRTDRMLADEVHRLAGSTQVLCAAESTLASTRKLFCPPTLPAVRHPEVRLIPGAWAAFKAGQHEKYHAMIAEAVQQARTQGADQVALAQVSMAAALPHIPPALQPLTSPQLALRFVLAHINRRDR
ncbi:glutamate racemase [Pantoea wallisii]|uniref:Glutamate racemase n=1 Tax=Pantoea wallisii TaxID=1076551 RepID=A0A1X1D7L8_9GAMM|nr:glutamate racemase [Pantoea wallisii]ORM72673.1 glutamate racemase [Pantoea wallisii]